MCYLLSAVRLFETPWTLARFSVHGIIQARILEWVAISFSRDLPDPGIKPAFLGSPALAGRFFTTAPPGKPPKLNKQLQFSSPDKMFLVAK